MFFPVLFCRFQILCQLRDELRKNSIIIMEVQKQPVEIPEKIIGEIAEWLDCGMVCFLNPETGKVETTLGRVMTIIMRWMRTRKTVWRWKP